MGKVSSGSFGAFVAGPDSKGAASQGIPAFNSSIVLVLVLVLDL
jgi:hypothetical protein